MYLYILSLLITLKVRNHLFSICQTNRSAFGTEKALISQNIKEKSGLKNIYLYISVLWLLITLKVRNHLFSIFQTNGNICVGNRKSNNISKYLLENPDLKIYLYISVLSLLITLKGRNHFFSNLSNKWICFGNRESSNISKYIFKIRIHGIFVYFVAFDNT